MLRETLSFYRRLLKEFMEVGASLEEAAQLAAAFVASQTRLPTRMGFFAAKNDPSAQTYRYRGIALEVAHFKIHENREGDRSFKITLRTKVGRTMQSLDFKGDQALRVAALLALKFERFEADLQGGFSAAELRECEFKLVEKMCANGKRMEYPDGDTIELNRNIKRKIESVLQLHSLLQSTDTSGRYRLELAPNLIDWDTAAWQTMDELTSGALSTWYEAYGFTRPHNESL